jgi:hypothetical protein
MLLTAKVFVWSGMGKAKLIDTTTGPDFENCVLLMQL